MAKPFYSLEEVCARLARSPDEVRALVREGTLREFRDAGKVFFKAEDVDKLASGGPTAQAGDVVLEPADEELPGIGSRGGTSVIGLAPLEDEPPKAKDDTVITSAGVGVFDEDEVEIDADPMAKTHITSATVDDQVSLEGTGSGSGLLDLTREADDTSLGAELLDEIYPGEDEAARARGTVTPPSGLAAAVEEAPPEAEAPQLVQPELPPAPVSVTVGDPLEGLFDGLMVGALLLLLVGATVVAGTLQGYLPDYAQLLSRNFWYFLGGAVLLPTIALLIGWLIGRGRAARRA